MSIAQKLLNDVYCDLTLFKGVITDDKKRVCNHDAETKAQSPKWKNVRRIWSNVAVLLTCIHPEGQTVNREYHLELMEVCVTHYHENSICGKTIHTFEITIMPLVTHRIWSPVTFSFSQN